MFLASSVVVAVAVGTPGIGYVSTALLLTQFTVVLPIVITSAASSRGRGVIGGASGFVPANAALKAPCGPDQRRIIRSSVVAGIGVALPWPATSSAPGMFSSHAYAPLTTSTLLQLCPLARVPAIWIRSPDSW